MTTLPHEFTMTIDGRAVAADKLLQVINPATEEVVTTAPDCSREQLGDAVAAARRAFPAWRATPLEERRKLVSGIGKIIGANIEEIARIFTLEQGRPLAKAAQEVGAAAFWIDAVSRQEIPVVVNEDGAERRSETRRVPIGVVGAIVPWNFPVLLGIWKIAGALLTGNVVVIKPSPFTPLTMLRIGELMRDHLPAGVFNVVSGGDDLGPWMTSHPDIDMISFTGSTQTGARVMAGAAASIKRVTLELGGNDPAIVLPDVNAAEIAEQLFWSAFANSGQICIATKRLYVHDDVYDEVAAELVKVAARTLMGNGLEQGVELGPIQNRQQYERVCGLLKDIESRGQKVLCGGAAREGAGYFVPVTLVDNPAEDTPVVAEEAFGPVLPIMRFTSVDEAIERANATPYGLGASVWSKDLDLAADIAARIESGTVWINDSAYVMPWTPFGGHKQSGLGTENGTEGLLEYTNPQTITIRKGALANA